jgi:hypothetical protein
MTLAERLLAGEHHGCESWAAVARRFGVDEKRLRVVRKTLAGRGLPVSLTDREGNVPGDGASGVCVPEREGSNPSVDIRPDRGRWPSVAAFDAGLDERIAVARTGAGQERARQVIAAPVVPAGHVLGGVSSYVVDGEVRGQWIKTKAENDERAAWLDALRSMSSDLPRCEAIAEPEHQNDDLLVVLPVGDPHVGLLSWHEDAGENFDLKIAERNLVAAFANLIARAPAASEALLVFIGDNTHADGQQNTTTKGTRVDVDGRTVKMARTIIDCVRQAVALSLEKFGRVTVIVERGNHDELLSAMIALALAMHYEDEPRVTVDQSPEMYHWFRFGSVLIGTHHGDKAKPEQLLGVMAVDRQKDWGETSHRRFYCGHYHHQIVKELPGLIVEYLPTLASSDAWHRAMGYRSSRAMYMDVFHREWGHIDRHIVGIRQLTRGAA